MADFAPKLAKVGAKLAKVGPSLPEVGTKLAPRWRQDGPTSVKSVATHNGKAPGRHQGGTEEAPRRHQGGTGEHTFGSNAPRDAL